MVPGAADSKRLERLEEEARQPPLPLKSKRHLSQLRQPAAAAEHSAPPAPAELVATKREPEGEDMEAAPAAAEPSAPSRVATEQSDVQLPYDAKPRENSADTLLADLLTQTAIDFCHGAFETIHVEILVLERFLHWCEDCFDQIIFDEETLAKHVKLVDLLTKDKFGNFKKSVFFEWFRKCVDVRERVLHERPAAPRLQSTAATGTPLLQSTAPTLSAADFALL